MPDLTTGPIGPTLVTFALPVLGTNILQSLSGTSNAFWVSHVLGPAALTATTNANQVFFLMMGAMFGVSMSANLLIGQAIGSGNRDLAKRVVGTCIIFFLVISLLVGLTGFLATPGILAAMGTPADARADATTYLRVIFMAIPIMYFFSFVQMAQRGTGDSRTPFFFALMAISMEVILNPILITGFGPFPKMGIAGSASATLICQGITLASIIIWLQRRDSILIPRRGELHYLIPDLTIIRSLIFKGLPMGLQMFIMSFAALTMTSFVNSYGSTTAAAYGVAMQMWAYVQMPAMALGMSVSSMAAQNVGAGRMDRLDQIARTGIGYTVLLSALPILLIYAAGPLAPRLFLPEGSPSIAIAQHINYFVLWGFIPFGMSFILSGIVRATGSVWPPLIAMVIAMWGIRIPVATLLQPWLGADAVWISFPIGSIASALLALAWYRWGNWRKSSLLAAFAPTRGEVPAAVVAAPPHVDTP